MNWRIETRLWVPEVNKEQHTHKKLAEPLEKINKLPFQSFSEAKNGQQGQFFRKTGREKWPKLKNCNGSQKVNNALSKKRPF